MSGAGLDPSNQVAARVQKLAQNQAKHAIPPVGPSGEGTHVNTCVQGTDPR